jgi:hypothetical protein
VRFGGWRTSQNSQAQDVQFLKIFSPKNSVKKLAFSLKHCKLTQKLDYNIVFLENSNFLPKFGKNHRKQ